jgi:hypothetical protein
MQFSLVPSYLKRNSFFLVIQGMFYSHQEKISASKWTALYLSQKGFELIVSEWFKAADKWLGTATTLYLQIA